MKHKFLAVILTLIAALCLCLGIAACDSGASNNGGNGYIDAGVTEGLQYQKRTDADGNEYVAVVGLGTVWETDIVIPSTFRGLPVKEIGKSAFNFTLDARNNFLTSITIPNSVTSIEIYVFDRVRDTTAKSKILSKQPLSRA